jgi:hypothetical protein
MRIKREGSVFNRAEGGNMEVTRFTLLKLEFSSPSDAVLKEM